MRPTDQSRTQPEQTLSPKAAFPPTPDGCQRAAFSTSNTLRGEMGNGARGDSSLQIIPPRFLSFLSSLKHLILILGAWRKKREAKSGDVLADLLGHFCWHIIRHNSWHSLKTSPYVDGLSPGEGQGWSTGKNADWGQEFSSHLKTTIQNNNNIPPNDSIQNTKTMTNRGETDGWWKKLKSSSFFLYSKASPPANSSYIILLSCWSHLPWILSGFVTMMTGESQGI